MNSASQFLFEVVAVSPQGSLLTERLRASDASKASEQLQLRGLRVLSCREIRTSNWKGLRRQRLDVGLFTDELAALLDAGLGMVDTLRTLSQKERDSSGRQALEAVTRDVIEGLPLSAALANRGGTFPPLLVASVSASEQTATWCPRCDASARTWNRCGCCAASWSEPRSIRRCCWQWGRWS